MVLSEPQGRSPLSEPKEYLHKIGIFLDVQVSRTPGIRIGEVTHQHTVPETLARQVLSLSADESKRVNESIEDCEPRQESKLDC